jgi:hypothetical protein
MGPPRRAELLAEQESFEAQLGVLKIAAGLVPSPRQGPHGFRCHLGHRDRSASPERASRARGPASLRLVVTRSPDLLGLSEGATPQELSPLVVRDRESPEPQGPASETNMRCGAFAGI